MVSFFIVALRDDRLYSSLAQPTANAGDTVGFVSSQFPWPRARSSPVLGDAHLFHQLLEADGFMALSGAQQGSQRQSVAITHQVQFRAETASGTAKGMI
jgi:hypothetical protein